MSDQILLVDDDDFIQIITRELLLEEGYEVDIASDGAEAWEKIDASPEQFDLMILDKNMPRLNGMELLKRLRGDERFKDFPVIMLTADTEQQSLADSLAAGAHYCLTKSSSESVLKNVIHNVLSDAHHKKELLSLIGHQTNTLQILKRAEFEFQTLDEAKYLSLWLADASLTPHRTVNAYSEILVNAVEHGNLEIDYDEKGRLLKEGCWIEEIESRLQKPPYKNRSVHVTLENTDTQCIVIVTDQGKGFNWQEYLEFSPERAYDIHGRGIAMSRMLGFDEMEYNEQGNQVTIRVNRDSSDAE